MRTKADCLIKNLFSSLSLTQSENKSRLFDEELVLPTLAYSSDEWLLTSQIGEFAFTNVREPGDTRLDVRWP